MGGSNSNYSFTAAETERLAGGLAALAERYGASLMVTVSRRTDVENEAILRSRLGHLAGEVWDRNGENPYIAILPTPTPSS